MELSADGDNVLITTWERGLTKATSDEPVGRMSADGIQKFNDMIRPSANCTNGRPEEEG